MAPGLRELKKAQTRAAIQQVAVDLFERQGYDATTCEQIAAGAGVSPATFFRYFASKDDVVVTDDYDPMILLAVRGRPAREGPLLAVRRGLADTFALLGPEELAVVRSRTALMLSHPALRARMGEQAASTRDAFATALAPRMLAAVDDLPVQALAAACAGALSVAVEHWAAGEGDLAACVDAALEALQGR